MVPRIYSQNYAGRLSALVLFLFASITSFGQNPPSFAIPGANCPPAAAVTIPMGANELVFSNANIEALLGSTAVDPDGDPVTYSASPSSVSCSDVGGGPVLITVTASDDEMPAMTATCVDIAVIVSSGGGLPSAVCQNITVNLSGGGLVLPADIDGGSFSCSGITMMMVNDGGGSAASKTYVCGDVGIQTLDLEITDAFGTSSCTATITVVDDIDPTFTCPLDQTETLDANCNIVIPDLLTGIVDEADACGAVTMTQSPTAGTLVPSSDGGTTAVTITATDVNGNTATCMVTLTGDDTTPPNAICLATLTVDLDASGNYTLTAAELDGGSSDNCGTTILSIPATAYTCADIATSPHVVTLTVNDGNGNMSTCMTSVTVQDGAGTPPPPLSNLTANNNFNDCEATVSFPNTAPDNCGTYPVIINSATHEKGSTILIFTSGGNYFGDFPIGITTINYSITDGGGNTTTADFTITVFDDEAPNVICPSTQTLNFANCNSANEMLPDYRSLLGVTDNCPVNQFVNIEQVPAPGTLLSAISTPADAEVIVVTFNVSDVNPSMTNMGSTCSFSVILNEDNTPNPNVLGAILAPINSECGPITIDAPTATDECGNIICGEPFPSVATLVTPCSVGPGGTGSLSETINPEPDVSIPDNNTSGNFSTGTVTAPAASSITDVNVTIDINHTWVGDLEATLTSPDGTVVELFNRPGVPAGTFGCAGNDLDVTFDDEATNTATDFENSCGNLPAITGSFQSTIPMSNFDGETPTGDWTLTVVDNAGGDLGVIASWTLDIEYSQPGGNLAQYEFPVGTHNITWNYDDGFGNTATQQQVITVTDDIVGPEITCQDIELELDAFGNASIINDDVIAPSAIELTGSNLTPCFNPVADTETDFSLMVSSSVTFDFDWDYFTLDGPAFDPFGYTVDGVYTELTNPGGSNSQSGSASVSLTAGQTFSFRAYTFDNTCGGSVTQIMNFSPGFTGDYSIGNWALSNTNGGNGDITDILDGMATDNCSDPADILLSLSQSNFDCSDLGANTVTLTATDEAGNSSQCTATVTIVDNIAPTLSGIPGDVTVACNAIPAVATGVTANDNCSTVGIIFNEISTQVLDESLCQYYTYEITRIWTVEDQSGNSVTETQVITVQDNQDPIFASLNFPSTVTANAAAGSCNAVVSLEMTGADVLDLPGCVSFDNLTITNNGNGAGTANATGTYPVGSTPVTFTVTDPCGNSSSYTVNVNVTDNTPPIAACNSISVGIPDGQDSIIIDASLIALIDNGSFDNCAGTAVDLSVSPNVFYCSQIADGTQDEFDITLAVVVPGTMDTTFCETTITIQDNNAPNITCVDPLVITLDANGTATATPAMLNGGIDDCSDIMTIELTGNTGFDLTDIGSHPISDGITPTLQVTDVHGNVETCTPTTLIVTPPTTCLTSVDVIDNGEVEIPYTSTNFTNVIGFQFSMQVDDETVATFAQDNAANLCGAVTINVPNLSGIHQSLICNGTFTNQISPDGKVLSVSWFNTSPNPVSITNGEPLFNFRIDALGVVGDMTTFSIAGAPYANELTTKYGNDILEDTPPLCVSPIGTFEVGDNATLPISGNVSTWNRTRIDTIGYDTISTMPLVTNPILDTVILIAGQGLANASLVKMETVLPFGATTTTDTDMTDANGDYTVQVANLAGGVALNLVPRKNNPNWLNNGDVNSSDLFFIQQHIVNNIPFSSIYDYVAADVNESGTITTLDLVLIQDVIVNPEISPIPSSVIDAYNPWRFIQREYAESDLDPFDLDPSISLPAQPMAPIVPAFEQNRTYNPAVLPMANTDWIAVKVGQIFGGLNTSTLTTNDVEDRTGENFVMSVENQKVRNGELISIPVYAKDYAAFIAWQFTLEFNENYLEYQGMLPGAIEGFGENKLGLNSVEEGIIGAIWYGTPNAVNSDEVLFTLQFTALDDADALSGLIDVTSRTVKSQSSLMSGATGEVSITFFSPAISTATDFELHQNRPNPFNGETLISFNLPEAGFARVIISDISGRTLKVVEGDYAKGYNEVRIQSNDFSSTGVLYYQLESAEHIATKKMIILE